MRSPRQTHDLARQQRGSMSRSEVLLWVRLRGRAPGKPTFRRQYPIGPYVADFFCTAAKLVVEVDGGVHEEDDRIVRDHYRDEYLRERGCTVLRISVREVLSDPDAAAAKICAAASLPPPSRSA